MSLHRGALVHAPDREQLLLLSCLGTGTGRIEFDVDGVHWPRFLALLDRHRVAPLVARRLADQATDLPTDVLSRLDAARRENALALLSQIRALHDVRRLLEAASVLSLVIKGPSLLDLYEHEADRHVGDLDLLLPDPRDAWPAVEALASGGWKDQYGATTWSATQRRIYATRRKDIVLFHEGMGTRLELHWRPLADPADWPGDIQSGRSIRKCRAGGCEFDALGEEETALLILLHGSDTAWSRLKWVVDASRMIERSDDADLERLVRTADRTDARIRLGLLTELLRALFDDTALDRALGSTDTPNSRKVSTTRSLAYVARQLDSSPMNEWSPTAGLGKKVSEVATRTIYLAGLQDGIVRRMSRARAAIPFDPMQWEVLPLPTALHGLYPVLEPVLLPISAARQRLPPTRRT